MDQPSASSRSLWGGPATMEITHVLNCNPPSVAVAMNLLPLGNHAFGHQPERSGAGAGGCGISRVSPVARSVKCIPNWSLYARYFPSGETMPWSTAFSLGFAVSRRSFSSRRADGFNFQAIKNPSTDTAARAARTIALQRREAGATTAVPTGWLIVTATLASRTEDVSRFNRFKSAHIAVAL
jgi:hypothetical protein